MQDLKGEWQARLIKNADSSVICRIYPDTSVRHTVYFHGCMILRKEEMSRSISVA
ncbi:hypothetical protein AA0242T_1551 [Acetobacter aceti NRIC 0242]|nr:hypothetical protein AA0242T_1551 [Acetobacter aceti NRIC 0242]